MVRIKYIDCRRPPTPADPVASQVWGLRDDSELRFRLGEAVKFAGGSDADREGLGLPVGNIDSVLTDARSGPDQWLICAEFAHASDVEAILRLLRATETTLRPEVPEGAPDVAALRDALPPVFSEADGLFKSLVLVAVSLRDLSLRQSRNDPQTPLHLLLLVGPSLPDSRAARRVGSGIAVVAVADQFLLTGNLIRAVVTTLSTLRGEARLASPGGSDPLGAEQATAVGTSQEVPGSVLDLPPAQGDGYSLTAWFEQRYPERLALPQVEFPDPEIRKWFKDTATPLYTPEAGSPPRGTWSSNTVLHVLRVCRQLATYERESRPYVCTFVLPGRAKQMVMGAWQFQTVKEEDYPTYLTFDPQVPFALSGRELRSCVELAQSERFVLVVDVPTARLTDVRLAPVGGDRIPDATRRSRCCDLARSVGGLVIHVRGPGGVEVYDKDDLRLWFVESGWRLNPFEKLLARLQGFFRSARDWDGLARRTVGVILHLLDRRASSILVFTTQAGWEALTSTSETEPWLRLMGIGRVAESRNSIKKRFPLEALVGSLQTDGAHVILSDGTVAGIGYEITGDGGSAGAGGTGTRAARRLSQRLGGELPGFVVQVSARQGFSVFQEGFEVE